MTITHGIIVTESAAAAAAITTVATAVIGLVATATAAAGADTAALNAAFPLDTPVLVTDLPTAIGAAGNGGTLRLALQAIADQCRAPVVVVRVATGADAAGTSANVVGGTTNGVNTGMQALLGAEAAVGVRPRILGCPGLDTQAVTTALAIVAQKLRGFAYASAIGANVAAAIAYRGQFSARELMLIYPDFVAFDPVAAANATSFAVARAMGLRSRIDQEQGWHKTLSNVEVQGVVGLTKTVQWDLQSQTTEAALLNQAGVTACIAYTGGYRFWGNRTTATDPNFAFESATRTAQVLMDSIAAGVAWAVDKPLRPSLVKDIVEEINAAFRQLKAQGFIIGARAWFDPAKNGQAVLASGQCLIDYDYTPCPPLETLGFTQRITDSYLADFASQLSAGA